MIDWMRTLSDFYAAVREHHAQDDLLVVFDIDGAILDERVQVHHALLSFDREHGTEFFYGLTPEEVTGFESDLEGLLSTRDLDATQRAWVRHWYADWCTSSEAALVANRPHRGIMNVIRWFQLQPHTHVALNSSRPESLRSETLRSLNAIGRAYRVRFASDLLMMRRPDDEDATAAKCRGLDQLHRRGYRIVAVIDSEQEHLDAMVTLHPEDVLFLRAGEMVARAGDVAPSWDVAQFINREDLPGRVRFVYHGVDSPQRLDRFRDAAMEWGECDVHFDPRWRLVARRGSFEEVSWSRDEEIMVLRDVLETLATTDKRLKLDLTLGGVMVERALALLDEVGWPDDRLWFNGEIDVLGEEGFAVLAERRPGAIRQCPVDFLRPLVFAMPERARRILDTLEEWGINRASVDWRTPRRDELIETLQEWGWEVNIYDVPDLDAFLQAVLMLPASLTSTFDLDVEQAVSAARTAQG